MCSVQVDTSSTVLVAARSHQVDEHRSIHERLRSTISHTRELVTCFKKLSLVSDSDGTDSLAPVPSTLMQVMTLERFVRRVLENCHLVNLPWLDETS